MNNLIYSNKDAAIRTESLKNILSNNELNLVQNTGFSISLFGFDRENVYCMTNLNGNLVGYVEEVDTLRANTQTHHVVIKDLNHTQILYFKITNEGFSKKVEVYNLSGKLMGYSSGVTSLSNKVYTLYNGDNKKIGKFTSFKGHTITFKTIPESGKNREELPVYQSEKESLTPYQPSNEEIDCNERAVLLGCLISIDFDYNCGSSPLFKNYAFSKKNEPVSICPKHGSDIESHYCPTCGSSHHKSLTSSSSQYS
ncbi:hypothetical protein BB559_005877 [Furculomyces boomerangus]|uniref:Uncharacterized protein n=2 Tax=Harpellales TaxID=61421 RepID=A0A2T9Y666_9FUNG|nr:hypothetical protein BB559_005877 [Furculomyces boomerangus]PWA01395.1 hypothetical protein BB558_002520 [Smittium angustum]